MSAGYELTVNGSTRRIDGGWPGEHLAYVLRERLGLPATKTGCEQGECGSCSVLVDGGYFNPGGRGDVDLTDGIGLDMGDWRFNLRSSNTEPVVRLNMESRGQPLAAHLAAITALLQA